MFIKNRYLLNLLFSVNNLLAKHVKGFFKIEFISSKDKNKRKAEQLQKLAFSINTILASIFFKNRYLLKTLFFVNNLLAKNKVRGYLKLKTFNIKRNNNRSIAFVEDSYYCYGFMADALRKRGWDAIAISLTPASYLSNKYSINLFDSNPQQMLQNCHDFQTKILPNYKMIHFYSFLKSLGKYNLLNKVLPIDIIALKKNGIKFGYTPSGCLGYHTQSKFLQLTSACKKCIWQDNPDVCSDQKNYYFINNVKKIADFISYETDNSIGVKQTKDMLISTEPTFYALDPKFWPINLSIPKKYRIKRKSPKHLLILTSFANEKIRASSSKDIKGIKSAQSAIQRLISEGHKIQAIHINNIPNTDVRYIQAQADIVIDQLVYGRYGAFAREAMMLAKPVISRIDFLMPELENKALKECPIVNASEDNIYDVLLDLIVLSTEERKKLGQQSRDYMLKWHSADKCAERFEKIYDKIMARN